MDASRHAEAAARTSYGKILAFIAARTGDAAGAEDALSEAFAAALTDWPANGIPDNPQAWLMTVARRRPIDAVGRDRTAPEASSSPCWPRNSPTNRRGMSRTNACC